MFWSLLEHSNWESEKKKKQNFLHFAHKKFNVNALTKFLNAKNKICVRFYKTLLRDFLGKFFFVPSGWITFLIINSDSNERGFLPSLKIF